MLCSPRDCSLFHWGLLAYTILPSVLGAAEFSLDHTAVKYEGIDKEYAEAIARTVEASREICQEKYGFDMPPRIDVTVIKDSKHPPRLFNDGVDQFRLSVPSDKDLHKPSQSGVFHLYGMCHEVSHLGMYRPIPQHNWMTAAAAEGWAHYLGSRLVDDVYQREGADLWPDKYDYRSDGTVRLEKQLAGDKISPTQQAARMWRELADIIGVEQFSRLFTAWGQVEIDPTDPAQALLPALKTVSDDPRTLAWWNQAESLFVSKQEKSGFTTSNALFTELTGSPVELTHDDDKPVGKISSAGGGHAVRFEKPAGKWFLTSVSIFGARYGARRPPREDFHIWLCDENLKVIADFPIPYSKFKRGSAKWVRLSVKPTEVPDKFVICAGFNPSGRKGVYVHYDAEGSGNSLSSLPGKSAKPFTGGDWMIRIQLDQLKSADALGTEK